MIVHRRAALSLLAALPVVAMLLGAAVAQEIKVRGQTIRISKRDKAWIKKRCEKQGHAEGTPAYQDYYDGWVKDILEQRARHDVHRGEGP